jgi:glycogen debranching enzyme
MIPMKTVIRTILLFFLLTFTNIHLLHSKNDSTESVLAGISNRGENKDQPYVTAGDRTYLIGTQDGNFPDMGDHVPGEMGGLWLHPIKLIDGFWAKVLDTTTNLEIALPEAIEFVNYPYGNRFIYAPVDGLEIERFQFSPDGQQGLIVQYKFTNKGNRSKTVKFQLSVKTDLTPVWFSERLGIKDAQDNVSWETPNKLFIAKDTDNTWFVVWGAADSTDAQPIANATVPLNTKGKGVAAASEHRISIGQNSSSTLTFVFTGSVSDKNQALNNYNYLAENHASLLEMKKKHYRSILERARITIPDQRLQEVYNWVKIDTEWLVRDVQGIGRGLGGGLMEYPWWFGTETYSLQAMTATGNFDLAKQTLRLLKNYSMKENGNGRIVHEITTNGGIYNPGNTQETAQFIITVGKLFEWSGDVDFLNEMYPFMKMSIHWLLNDMDQNKNLFPEGYGIMEVYGLNAELIDVAVYTQQALKLIANIATILNDPDAAKRYQELASKLKTKINDDFWAEDEGSYCDFYGNKAQAISAAEGAIKQITLKGENKLTKRDHELIEDYKQLIQKFSSMPNTNRGWITNKNWVITTPMETGIAPKARAIQLLDKIRKENVGEYGPYLSAVEKQAMMTISTGVQAISEGNYGRTDEAMWYVNKIVQTFNRKLPGSISEMMPDYGCFTIAWTSYGIVVPLIQHIFGVQPDAINKTVVFEPHLPTGWENISIDNLPIGTNIVSFARTKTDKGIEYNLTAKDKGWNLVLKPKDLPGAKYYLNGRPVSFTSSGISMIGTKNHILVVQPE